MNNPVSRPLVLCDLDDTLFQTLRKMKNETHQEPVRIGAFDRQMEPRSFMSQEQSMLVDWLLSTAELVPVTARGTEETSRVNISFSSWKIMTHGAVITRPDGSVDPEWQDYLMTRLHPMQARLNEYRQRLSDELDRCGLNAWCRMNNEYNGTAIYFVMKHRDSTRTEELYRFNQRMQEELDMSGFYVHQNGNNVAWLPECVQKGLAASWLLKKLRAERGQFPVIGLGDSLSDHAFMAECHWYGMPSRSQFADAIQDKIFREKQA
ncbi:MAG: hypothetical protein E7J63_19130 [Pantoea sp.]|uniref:hypothetical protein n=1 Tax=Pantoea TaxID=53335 RepID=UPI0006608F0C|nr:MULTISPECIES: hypothetical protein [Pantoea]MDU7840400.1 hypothetical protein [Pantoea sp.]